MTGSSDGQTSLDVRGFFLARRRVPTAKYTVVGETLRHVIPSHMQCSIGCGGKACKYEDPTRWTEDQQAIKGLYSSWVTDKLLAMARPSTEVIEKFNMIEQFRRNGVRTVINLQQPGEHASCGNPLEPDSGFTYCPEAFMEAGIYFYNYGWTDYGVTSLTALLDIVKVMCFAVQEGKVAVHCHAGLGRTGVLLACFLVFSTRMTADQAILSVRDRRPNSIQTRGQLQCVRQFSQFLVPLRNVFSCAEPKVRAVTLDEYLVRQKNMLHGYEARQLRNVPKLIYLVSKLLPDIAENREIIAEEILDVEDLTEEMEEEMQNAIYSFRQQSRRWEATKGLSGLPPRLPGLPTAGDPAHPLHFARKSLSFSDTDIQRLAAKLDLADNPLEVLANMHKHSSSQENLSEPFLVTVPGNRTPMVQSPSGSQGSVWDIKTQKDKHGSALVLNKQGNNSLFQRSKSVTDKRNGTGVSPLAMVSAWKAERNSDEPLQNGPGEVSTESEWSERSEVPFITLQTELTLESRHLLLAQALALDLEVDGQNDHMERVAAWQKELNCGAGVWEQLCLERDPFILAGLMWSWLEQLKEPVLTAKDVLILGQGHCDPNTILNRLNKSTH
ncbi:protein tyrosine phosphatase domain-containing protein 1 [Sardina pilchardus]|uniref:protein tyrosine phosphatase domain-containing protein 1 n=1 Tax=Sardina pilchardus TaxID=27697 RepID=UPI002E0F4AB3